MKTISSFQTEQCDTPKTKGLRFLGMTLVAWLLLHAPDTMGQTLYAYYPFNGNAQDKSGRGNHGVVHGGTLCPDRHGTPNRAYCFDGNDYIVVGTGVKPSFPITFTAWLNGSGHVFSNDKNSTYRGGFHVHWNPAGGDSINVTFFDGGYARAATRTTQAPIGVPNLRPGWHHLAIVMTGVANTSWYIDGKYYPGHEISDGGATTMRYLDGSGAIGTSLPQYPTYFNGAIDELRVYHGTLSLKQIITTLPEYDCDPEIIRQPECLSVTNSAPAQFTVEATCRVPFSYQWYRVTDNTEVAMARQTNSALVIARATSNFEGEYFVAMSNYWGVTASRRVRLHVCEMIPDAGYLASLKFPTSHGKQYEVITASALGDGDCGEWDVASGPIPGTGAEYTAHIKPSGLNQFFRIRETDGTMPDVGECVVSQDSALAIVEQPGDQRVPYGGTAMFMVKVTANKPVTIQWQCWGESIDDDYYYTGTETCALTINDVDDLLCGIYRVVVGDGSSQVTSDWATLSVDHFRTQLSFNSQVSLPAVVGNTYQIDYSTNLYRPTWHFWCTVQATEPMIVLNYTNGNPAEVHFRASTLQPAK